MDSIFFQSKHLISGLTLAITCLSALGNSAYCEELSVKNTFTCTCRGEKKYINFSDLLIDKDCMILKDYKGVKLLREIGCDEGGYYVYTEAENQNN